MTTPAKRYSSYSYFDRKRDQPRLQSSKSGVFPQITNHKPLFDEKSEPPTYFDQPMSPKLRESKSGSSCYRSSSFSEAFQKEDETKIKKCEEVDN